MMNIEEAILARRSIRTFKQDEVSDEAILKLLKAAMAAPSACNRKPWLFYVVKNKEKQMQLRQMHRYSDYDSPLIIIVCADMRRKLGVKSEDFWIQDCSASVENLMLEAVGLGMGTCWCGLHPIEAAKKRVVKILNMPEHVVPVALIHVGHPAEHPTPRTQYDESLVTVIE